MIRPREGSDVPLAMDLRATGAIKLLGDISTVVG